MFVFMLIILGSLAQVITDMMSNWVYLSVIISCGLLYEPSFGLYCINFTFKNAFCFQRWTSWALATAILSSVRTCSSTFFGGGGGRDGERRTKKEGDTEPGKETNIWYPKISSIKTLNPQLHHHVSILHHSQANNSSLKDQYNDPATLNLISIIK